jgi:hypothetical protein
MFNLKKLYANETNNIRKELWCNLTEVAINVKLFVIDLFENLAKHNFSVRYGLSSEELHQIH